MDHLSDNFNTRIISYRKEIQEAEEQRLLDRLLQYANANPDAFKTSFNEIRFDKDLSPLPFVLEALAKDTANWGQFYVDLLEDIFQTAKHAEKPNEILTYLTEFAYIEKDDNPFIQIIADVLFKELSGDNLETKLAAIYTLPNYLANKAVRNRPIILDYLQQLLNDNNWKIRVVTFKALSFKNLLPSGYKLSFRDKLFKLFLGEPKTI